MKKPLLSGTMLLVLSGCTMLKNNPSTVADTRPAGLVEMLKEGESGTYADMRRVSSHQGNPRLRQLYLLRNYDKTYTVKKEPVRSSRVINVFNCDTHERTQFERIYFTERWAQGNKVFKREIRGQWQTFPEESLIGIIAGAVCSIDPAHLKPEPPADTQTAIYSE